MPEVFHRAIAYSPRITLSEVIREANLSLRKLSQDVNPFNIERWDDLRFPASSVNLSGASSPPSVDTTLGTLLFRGVGLPQAVAFQVQMPHAWKEGSLITPHVHWAKTTSAAGTVNWRLYYRHLPINEVMDVAWTTIDASAAVPGTPDTNTANKHLITSFGDVDMSGRQISDILICVVERDPALVTDTYGANAMLLEIDIHYQLDSAGSRREFIK